jgi:hypothetical protein
VAVQLHTPAVRKLLDEEEAPAGSWVVVRRARCHLEAGAAVGHAHVDRLVADAHLEDELARGGVPDAVGHELAHEQAHVVQPLGTDLGLQSVETMARRRDGIWAAREMQSYLGGVHRVSGAAGARLLG